jgi:hypothetical protein
VLERRLTPPGVQGAPILAVGGFVSREGRPLVYCLSAGNVFYLDGTTGESVPPPRPLEDGYFRVWVSCPCLCKLKCVEAGWPVDVMARGSLAEGLIATLLLNGRVLPRPLTRVMAFPGPRIVGMHPVQLAQHGPELRGVHREGEVCDR